MRVSTLYTAFVSSSGIRSPTSITTSHCNPFRFVTQPFGSNLPMSLAPGEGGTAGSSIIPELVVFDLDACLWDQEMYEMPAMPGKTVMGDLNGRGKGVASVMSGRHKISLHKGSLIALQEHADGKLYPGMKIALASSADTPFAEQIGRATLQLLEVIPGEMTVWDLLMRDWDGVDVNQIGRQPPLLSSNKAKSHFPNLKKATGIRYDKMLFFDDCNWGDHCGMVAAACKEPDSGKGVATYRTPYGLREQEWRQGLQTYADSQL
jgi:magnesium-dependent phosphatase 1